MTKQVVALEVKPSTNSGLPYTDGSGAPATVTVRAGGQLLRYALDFVGEAKLHLLSNAYMTKNQYRQAAAVATEAYTEWLTNQVAGEWFSKNNEMYS